MKTKERVQQMVERYSCDSVLEAHVTIPPHSLRDNLHYAIHDRLARSIRGRCTESDGFVLELKRIPEGGIRGGQLDKRSGSVHYVVEYIARTLRPNVGDEVEAIVSRVLKMGVFADLGPLNIFIPYSRIPEEYTYQTLPVPSFTIDDDPSKTIRPGSEIHVRLQKIAMLDDNLLPNNATCCVLKAMGELLGVDVSIRSRTKQRQPTKRANFFSPTTS